MNWKPGALPVPDIGGGLLIVLGDSLVARLLPLQELPDHESGFLFEGAAIGGRLFGNGLIDVWIETDWNAADAPQRRTAVGAAPKGLRGKGARAHE